MKDMTKMIVGGLTLVGLAVTGYRAYEIKKLRDAVKEDQVIDIEPSKVEESRK